MCMAADARGIRRMVLAVAWVVLASGCADSKSEQSIKYSKDPNRVIFEVETRVGGPIQPPAFVSARLPEFVLYGDGTLLTTTPTYSPLKPNQPLEPPTQVRRMTRAGVAALLEKADKAGLLGQAKSFGDPLTTEAPAITTLEFNVDDEEVTQSLALIDRPSESLAFDPQPSEKIRKRRAAALSFYRQLSVLETWLPAGSINKASPARFEEFSFFYSSIGLRPPFDEQVPQIEFPFGTLAPLPAGNAARCAPISAEQMATLSDVHAKNAGAYVPAWRSGGALFNVAARPVLPGEAACSN